MGFDELVQHDASELTKGTLPAERLPSEGVDADTLDGYEGGDLAALSEDETITGKYDFGDAPGVNSRLNVDVRSNSNVTSASGWGSDDIFNPADYDTATFGRRNAGHGLSAIRIIAQRDGGTTVGSRIGVLTNDVGNERLSIRFGITSMTEVISIRADGGVGIGATFPINTLGVNGAAVIGSSFAGSNTAPTDGLLVEGKIEMSSNGAGLFVNSNGDVVAVDDSGNTNVLT